MQPQQRAQTGNRNKAYIFLVITVIVASVASALVMQVLQKSRRAIEAARAPTEVVDVVVAVRTLKMGVPIGEDDVALESRPPEDVVQSATYTTLKEVMGRTPRERILPYEPIRSERLAREAAGVGLNALIETGHRAMAVKVKSEEAVAGFIRPGNYVDVIVTIRPDNRNIEAKAVSKVLLQGIKVLAMGNTLESNEPKADDPKKKRGARKKADVVTLEVTLEQAEQIALSSARGDIHLALCPDIDIRGEPEETPGITATDLIGGEPRNKGAPVYAAPAATGPQAEIISGGERTGVRFGDAGATEIKNRRKR